MRRGQGYSFVELLLALLVFSLGAMAVAAMQLGAVQVTRSAAESAAALLLAENLLQRVRADPGSIARYQQALDGETAIAPDPAASCLDGSQCPPAAWARHSLDDWLSLGEQRHLTAPRACVALQSNTLQVGVSWESHRGVVPPAAASCFTAEARDGRRQVTLRAPLGTSP
ncbi:MAG: type IV pilus modification protein PilV [Chromatocurvus sp.]